jgi:hypothetical protein
MKTDGVFDFRVCSIPVKYNRPFNIFFQGDEHYNSPNFARDKWECDISEMGEICKKEQSFFVKTGDVFEALSTTEREHFKVGGKQGFHEGNKDRWSRVYRQEIDEYISHVDFMIGRTLAVYGGNHFFQFFDGTTSDMALANALKSQYIGCSGYIILNMVVDKYHTHTLKIFCHHGRGSGRRAGSSFNAPEDAASYFRDADIVVMGHDHQAGAMRISSLQCDMGRGGCWKIKDCERIIGRSGSYLASYERGKPSYAVDAIMRPSTLGCLRVVVNLRRKDPLTTWVELKAIV